MFCEPHVSSTLAPGATVVGEAVSVTTGAATAVTERVLVTEPPLPVHVSVKSEVPTKGPFRSLPLVGLVPPHAPEAVQLVASLVDHLSVVSSFQ